jgi:biopolymer transport protein ExbB
MNVKFSSLIITMLLAAIMATTARAQTNAKFDLFKDTIPQGTQWTGNPKAFHKGGYTSGSKNYIYLKPSDSHSSITGLSIPVRENPKRGEYRYITFTWVKWGGGQLGMRFNGNDRYTYFAGEGDSITKGLKLEEKVSGHWMVTTRDLWKDFGDFNLTSIAFLCPTRRDAGFDAIVLGTSPDAFEGVPGILPTKVGASVTLDDDSITLDESVFLETEDVLLEDEPQGVQIDWAAQIRAGGVWMYPLYALGLFALIIALQRLMTSRRGLLAPKKLCNTVTDSLLKDDIKGALDACDRYPSTLASSLRFIFEHYRAGKDAVAQTAGDIAARDIRAHLARIYPLSVVASVAPLLGLLGTIVGMIEAFGLVALYGDEGGAAILSDSISKALITTAAGLIIAAPSVCLYFIVKNRIMSLASQIEVEIEKVIISLYLTEEDNV